MSQSVLYAPGEKEGQSIPSVGYFQPPDRMSVRPMDVPPSAPYQNPPPYENPPSYETVPPPPAIPATGGVGLELLSNYRKVILQQQLDVVEAVTFMDMPNKYILYDMDENPLMWINEVNSGFMQRHRALDVIAKDAVGQKLFHITRPSKPCSLCAFCCGGMPKCKYEGDVALYDQNERHLGHLTQRASFASARLIVEEKDGDLIYKINGENACCVPCTEYKIIDKHDEKVGEIEKQGMGIGMGFNKYEIKFPEHAKPNDKALIIGLNILIDYRFHFNARQPPQRRRR